MLAGLVPASMNAILRYFMLFALVVWVGGIIFFSFAVAPVVFAVLPTTALAGAVVSRSLSILHWMGLGSGMLFLSCSIFFSMRLRLAGGLVLLMMVLTGVSQFVVIPRMVPLRRSMDAALIAAPAPQAPGRADRNTVQASFNRLHKLSVGLEGATLILGLMALGSMARNAWKV